MEKNLVFKKTLTVEQFKSETHSDRVDVRKNPKTGNLFFTCGSIVGAVTSKGCPEHPMFSLVQGDPTHQNPTGEFWLLHEEGKGAPVLASF